MDILSGFDNDIVDIHSEDVAMNEVFLGISYDPIFEMTSAQREDSIFSLEISIIRSPRLIRLVVSTKATTNVLNQMISKRKYISKRTGFSGGEYRTFLLDMNDSVINNVYSD